MYRKDGYRDELRPVQGGGEDTEERVIASHTKKCEKSENYAKESQEAKVKLSLWIQILTLVLPLKEFKIGLEKKELDRKTNHRGLMKLTLKDHVVVTVVTSEGSLLYHLVPVWSLWENSSLRSGTKRL